MPRRAVGAGRHALTVVAGVPQSGHHIQVTSCPSWNALVGTFGSSTHVPSTTMRVLVGSGGEVIEARRAPPVLRRVHRAPGSRPPFQLPTTSMRRLRVRRLVPDRQRAGTLRDRRAGTAVAGAGHSATASEAESSARPGAHAR